LLIRLLVTDLDGTLVAPDKSLPSSAVAAGERLREAGVLLALVSARPPFGMRYVAEGMRPAAVAGFNGGTILGEDGATLERHLLPGEAGQQALGILKARGIPAWLFTGEEWLITDPAAHYVALETRTVRQPARFVERLEPFLGECGKIVGSTVDHGLLARVEEEMQDALGQRAAARRSQPYYLDVTNARADKGFAVQALCRQLGVAAGETACIGDGWNDTPMFAVAGFSIAMGNAEPDVQALAQTVTGRNDGDGWAEAVDRLVLPRAGVSA